MPCCFLLMIDSAPTTGSTPTLLLFAILPLLDDDVFVLEDFELCEPILMIVSMIAVLNYQSFCCISMREFKRVMVFDNNTPTSNATFPKTKNTACVAFVFVLSIADDGRTRAARRIE